MTGNVQYAPRIHRIHRTLSLFGSWFWYWRQLDDCFCWWRWLEYSASASLMSISIAITLGIREQNSLAGLFMLTWATQAFGFLVEYISTPKAYVDDVTHKFPVGPDQFEKFRQGDADYGKTNYYTDPRALKMISQDQWSQDRPLYDIQNPDQMVAKERRDYFVGAQRTSNYIRRMVPHIFGWFTMSSVWVILIVHLEWAKLDLSKVTDRTIPEWVDATIYGTAIIFMSFSFVSTTRTRCMVCRASHTHLFRFAGANAVSTWRLGSQICQTYQTCHQNSCARAHCCLYAQVSRRASTLAPSFATARSR